jgi:hypothetical protein
VFRGGSLEGSSCVLAICSENMHLARRNKT